MIMLGWLLTASYATYAVAAPHDLRFRADGTFKIVQFTDLHLIAGDSFKSQTDSTIALIERLIVEERPDLAVLTGDLVVSHGAANLWRILVRPFVMHQVPFAVTFGNHDPESDWSKAQVMAYLATVPYNLTFDADSTIDGAGNSYLRVLDRQGNTDWLLYLLDTHGYTTDDRLGNYDWVKPSQIQWYRSVRDAYAGQSGRVLPSLAFFHIPTPEYATVRLDGATVGTAKEEVCAPRLNSGLIAAFMERGDMLGTFVGHDHNNDFIGTYFDRIALAYGRKTGYAAAYTEVLERGARIIRIYEGERRFDSYIRTWDHTHHAYAYEQKLVVSDSHPIANGSFIQQALIAQWDDRRWQEEFQTLKDAGMRYIVLAPTYWVDKTGKIRTMYPSALPGAQPGQSDLVDACLRNAEKAGFRVFMGLNFDDRWWQTDFTGDWLNQQMAVGNLVADELFERYATKYPNAFYGWYWVWEVANVDPLRLPEGQRVLAEAINVNLDHLNARYPSMPIMLAPFMNYRLGSAKEYADMWKQVFAQTRFKAGDIFAPQDCVGAGGLKLELVSEWFAELAGAVKTKPELRFWSDAETFDQRFWTSATLTRFVEQMEAVKPYVSGIITFAYCHYYSPKNQIDDFHRAYVDYVRSGVIRPVSPIPPVRKARKEVQDGAVTITWEASRVPISGYYIYRDGERIADIQLRKVPSLDHRWVDRDGQWSAVYTVTAYDATGYESEPTAVN